MILFIEATEPKFHKLGHPRKTRRWQAPGTLKKRSRRKSPIAKNQKDLARAKVEFKA